MKAHNASLINAILLIAMAAWGYLSSETPSPTALIPLAFGALILACYKGIKAEHKVISHIAVLLTLIVLVALFMPLRGAIGRGDLPAIVRVAIMMASTAMAMVFFVKSFIEARRRRP